MTGMEAMMGLSAVGTGMQVLGTIAQGNTAAAEGAAQQQALNYQARQKEVQAGQERAAAQRNAIGRRKEAELASSRGLAVAAASGGGAMDPTVVDLLGDIEGEGEYRALMEMYGGEQAGRNLESGASLNRYEGQMAYAAGQAKKKNSRYVAAGQAASGIGSAAYMGYKAGMFGGGGAGKTILDDTNFASMWHSFG